MQKYAPMTIIHREGETEAAMREDAERGEFYYAADVDARIAELEKALRAYFTFSEELSRLIDDDKDVRALKLALAMAGHRPKYRSDVDEARNALMVSVTK
jgi:hypothetical protein